MLKMRKRVGYFLLPENNRKTLKSRRKETFQNNKYRFFSDRYFFKFQKGGLIECINVPIKKNDEIFYLGKMLTLKSLTSTQISK